MRADTCKFINTSHAVTLVKEAKNVEDEMLSLADDCNDNMAASSPSSGLVDVCNFLQPPTKVSMETCTDQGNYV